MRRAVRGRERSWAAALLLAAAAAGCDGLPTPTAAPGPDDELAAAVRALGFRSEGLQVTGKWVVVEGDILLDRAKLTTAAKRPAGPMTPRFQYHAPELVSQSRIYDVTVDLSELHQYPAWQEAARAAMPQWSSIYGSYIRMREGSPGGIKVTPICFDTNQDRHLVARAGFPMAGEPGAYIEVNICFDIPLSQGSMTAHMMHELGHTIGFRHTDEPDPVSAVHVSGTPVSGGDPASLMNTSFKTSTLSDYDRLAARKMYPLPAPQVSSVNLNGYPLISWTLPPGATGAYAVRLLHNRYERYGRLPPETTNEETQLTTGSGTSWHDTQHAWTGASSCSVMTTNYTRKESWLYEVVIYFANGPSSATTNARIARC